MGQLIDLDFLHPKLMYSFSEIYFQTLLNYFHHKNFVLISMPQYQIYCLPIEIQSMVKFLMDINNK